MSPPAEQRYDIVILGGGAAGCAAALCLRALFPSLTVLLVEGSAYDKSRPGEVLPGLAHPLLRQLGVLEAFEREHFLPVYASAAAWGAPQLQENPFIFSTWGNGWHVDRARFDAMLAREVELRGAQVLRATRWVGAERVADGFQLVLSGGVPVSARFVIDSTGRSVAFARAQGARPVELDRLFGFTRYVAAASGSDPRTLVESFAEGWWYTALLPGGLRVVACMTDVDLGRELGLLDPERWARLLSASHWVKQVVGDTAIPESCLARPASSRMLRPVCGEGWLACGDAALAFDPLSAQGIVKALRSGVTAAYAAVDSLVNQDGTGLRKYEALQQREVHGYARAYARYFAQEQRWHEHRFWRRRHGGTAHWGEAASPPSRWLLETFQPALHL